MSFIDCIDGSELSTSQKTELKNKYNELYSKYSEAGNTVDASAKAAADLVARELNAIKQNKINTMKDLVLWEMEVMPKLDRVERAIKESDVDKTASKLKFVHGSPARRAVMGFLEDTSIIQNSLERTYNLRLAEFADKFRSKAGGFITDAEGVKDVVRSAMGGKTTNKASEAMGKAVRNVFEELWVRYKAAGGIGGTIDNYFPQVHNVAKIKKLGFDKWKQLILKTIDREKMIDLDTGMPIDEKKLLEMLPDIYEGIRTNGLNELADNLASGKGLGGGKSFAAKRSSSRFFVFKDPEAFFEYNSIAGTGDEGIFDLIFGHIHAMTRDIAVMEKLGPKPETMFKRLQAFNKAKGGGPMSEWSLNGMYNTLTGRNNHSGEVHWSYTAFENLQHYARGVTLTATPISMFPDSYFTAATAKLNGLDSIKATKQYLNLFNPADPIDRNIAKAHVYISSVANGGAIRHAGVLDEFGPTSKKLLDPRFLSQATHRLTGAAFATDASRVAIILNAQNTLATFKEANIKYSDLPPAMLEAFKRWDMDEIDYNNIMKSEYWIEPTEGGKFINEEVVLKSGYKETAEKLSNWFTDMSLTASNEPNLLIRALSTGMGSKRGTGGRATASALMMFKTFTASVTIRHIIPEIRKLATPGQKSSIGQLMLFTTVLGALSSQLSNIVNGQTPEDMLTGKFAMKAMMRGGGLGAFGDFLFQDYSRYGHSLAETMGGPMVTFASDWARVFNGNLNKALDENMESKFLQDVFQVARRQVPFIRMWYLRPFMERLILDNIEAAIDPNFYKRRQRMEKNLRKRGSSFLFQ